MDYKRARRNTLLALAIGLGGAVLLLVSFPAWFPWVLRPLAGKFGAQFRSYQADGYAGFSIQELSWTNRTIMFRAGEVRGMIPTIWLYRLRSGDRSGKAFVSVRDWSLVVNRAEGAATPRTNSNSSTYSTVTNVESVLAQVAAWVPKAEMFAGRVSVPGATVRVPRAEWLGDTSLRAEFVALTNNFAGTAAVHFASNRLAGITAQVPGELLSVEMRVQRGPRLEVRGSGEWRTNQFSFEAGFPQSGWLPLSARVQAPAFRVPAHLLRIPEYGELTGRVDVAYASGTFKVEAQAEAQPVSGETNLPPLDVVLAGEGTTNRVTIHSATITSPFLFAELSRDLSFNLKGELLSGPARLRVAANLDRQGWLKARGQLHGDAYLTPQSGNYPLVKVSLAGTNVAWREFEARELKVAGELNWPGLNLREVAAVMRDGTRGVAQGHIDFKDRVIRSGEVNLEMASVNRWLPPGYALEQLKVAATCSGSFTNIEHQGTFACGHALAPGLRSLALEGGWAGQQLELARLNLQARGSNVSLALGAEGLLAPAKGEVRIEQFSIFTNETVCLALEQPGQLSWKHVTGGGTSVGMELRWSGLAGVLGLEAQSAFPEVGKVHLLAENLNPAFVRSWTTGDIPEVQIGHLNFAGNWSNGPVTHRWEMRAVMPAKSLAMVMDLQGRPDGTAISNLVVMGRESPVVEARGFVPIVVVPSAGSNALTFLTNSPVAFSLRTRPDAFFWDELGRRTGLILAKPEVQADLSGTWQALEGWVRARAESVEMARTNRPIPRLENFVLSTRITREAAKVEQVSFRVQGQPFVGEGEVPLGKQFWAGLRTTRAPVWERARGRLSAPRLAIAAFEPLYPKLLSPQGEIQLEVELKPGLQLDGHLLVRDARLRPLATLGAVRDIQVNAIFTNRLLHLESASATIGGSTVRAAGDADFAGTNWWAEGMPPFELVLRGTNVPLSRKPESIIRSDLAVAVTKTNGAPPMVSGHAHLRDSMFLSDITSLVSGGVATPEKRPPYFSISQPPLAEWRLGLKVDGTNFMHVRSTIFNGSLSANLNLWGTLKDPIALGDLKIDSGTVRFPFANLGVTQGFVTLGSQDPYRPQLNVTAAARQYGYDIRMDVTGLADAPLLQFTSTPPLDSEQILLMVTAGEMPRQNQIFSMQQRAQTFALFLGKDLLSKLGIGDSGEQRLTITSGEEISEQGRPTYGIEYKLNDRWSLVGEYDRFNAFNAGVKWRVYQR